MCNLTGYQDSLAAKWYFWTERLINNDKFKICPQLKRRQAAHLFYFLPLYKSPVGQANAVLPQDVRHRQRDAHMSGNISKPLVKLLKLL